MREICPIERSVMPPILRARSAIGSVNAEDLVAVFVMQKMIVAEVRPALGLPDQRLHFDRQSAPVTDYCPDNSGTGKNGCLRLPVNVPRLASYCCNQVEMSLALQS